MKNQFRPSGSPAKALAIDLSVNKRMNYLMVLSAAILLFVCLGTFSAKAQTSALEGAWELDAEDTHHQVLFKDGFFIHTMSQGDQFMMTQGGTYTTDGKKFNGKVLFNSSDSVAVGNDMDIPFSVSGTSLTLAMENGDVTFKRLDDGKAPLAGVWRITGRMQDDGKVAPVHQTGTRQTYKMLTGSKFQWVAIDPGKKQFSGTGSGSYTFENGKYTEKIEVFSRDKSRVGASLSFDGKLQDGSWHHSGLSSKGDKIYEIWSKVK